MTAIGANVLLNNTTGDNNVGVGGETDGANAALKSNTTGNNNVGIGGYSLQANTTGSQNTAVGQAALALNTTASGNVGMGHSALLANTTGTNNTALGTYSLQANTTADNNTAVGYQAGYANTTGRENVYIGKGAGLVATTANSNTFVGRDAGTAVTTGGANTLIGETAGASLTTGTKNTFVGGGLYTVDLGAGGAITTGSKNTIIGAYTGNQNGLDIRTLSNYIVLSDGDGNPRAYHDGTNWTVNGGIYIGGTGAANLLDDYEEGTWTTTFSDLTNLTGTAALSEATYTKIGRVVHIEALITGTSVTTTGTTTVINFQLPFSASANSSRFLGNANCTTDVNNFGIIVPNTNSDATTAAIIINDVNLVGASGLGVITISLTYNAA